MQTKAPIYFVGIGGIGMSGIAELMTSLGYQVQGSDMAENANVTRLKEQGLTIHIGHDAAHIPDNAAAVVISSAIKPDNVELQAARDRNIPVIRRAEMLAELMRLKRGIAIGGTHGKTTTTSMMGQMMEVAGFDPTVVNGGIVNAYGTNTRQGQGEWIVVEADESDGSFTRLPAEIAIVTNIDPEHMEHYGDFDAVKEAYRQFILNVPFYGFAVLCSDHPEVQALMPSVSDRRIITYGYNKQADVRAYNIKTCAGGHEFDVDLPDGKTLTGVYLRVLGHHNVQNALAVLAVASQLGISPALMKKGLREFTGVRRRFTKTGEANGITIIDDYAHHPVEIETVLKTARLAVEESGGRVIAVKQPHRYSRLHDLFEEFCTCFNEADYVIIADVYEAGEQPIEGADRASLAAGITRHGHRHVQELAHKDDLASLIADIGWPGDIVVCLGAGDITKWAQTLPGDLENTLRPSPSRERATRLGS